MIGITFIMNNIVLEVVSIITNYAKLTNETETKTDKETHRDREM